MSRSSKFENTNRNYLAAADVQMQRIFLAICRSFVSPTVPLTGALCEDRQGNLCVSWDCWTFAGLCDEGFSDGTLAWQKSQFEAILKTASELRRKFRLMDEFIADPFSYAEGVNLWSDPHSIVSSVCDALSFFAEAKKIAAKALESEKQFCGLHHFDDFLQLLKKRFSEFPHYLENLLKSKNDQRATEDPPICTFWADFLQHLEFWPIYEAENPLPAWRTALFEGMVRMLGNYLTLRLKSAAIEMDNWKKLDFLESVWANDEFVLSRLNFIANFGQIIPLKMLEENGQLCSFQETFVSHLRKFKEDGRLRFTRCFLVQLVRQTVIHHNVQLDNTLLVHLSKENLLRTQLTFLINVTSLNSYWIREHPKLFDENGPLEKGINDCFAEQFWPLRILLDQRLYHLMFAVCGRLRRVQRSLLQLLDVLAIGCRFRRRLFSERPTGFLCGALGAQLMGQLQRLLNLLFTYFLSLNSVCACALVETVEKPRDCVANIRFAVSLGVVDEWKSALTHLLLIFDDIFKDPIDEMMLINDAFCEFCSVSSFCPSLSENVPHAIGTGPSGGDGIDEAELRLLGEWSDRLRRVGLYIRHRRSNRPSEFAKTAADEPPSAPNHSTQCFSQFPFASPTHLTETLKLIS